MAIQYPMNVSDRASCISMTASKLYIHTGALSTDVWFERVHLYTHGPRKRNAFECMAQSPPQDTYSRR